jgi:RNA polymerase sigma factor (sigma-70 family)
MSPGISTRLLATQSDERLLRLVREGHERAFEALVNRYRKPLLSYCRRLSLPEARTEDVLQHALLKTWIALRDGAEVRDIKAWLYRVVHNAAVNAVRDAAHDRERVADPTLRIEGGHADIERGLIVREALAEVAALPPLQREVIVRTAVGGYSHEQVASDLGLSDGAVRGLLYRARTTLRTATTALTPPQLLIWLAGRADQGAGAPERLGELAAGGGTVGLGGLLLKGGVAAVTAGTLITGAAVVQLQAGGHRHHGHPGAVAATRSNGAYTTGTGASVAAASTGPNASAATIGGGHAPVRRAHIREVSAGAPVSTIGRGGTGEPGRGNAPVQHRSPGVAPGSVPVAAVPTAPASAGPVSSGSGSDQGSSTAGAGGVSSSSPVVGSAGVGSSSGAGSEAPPSGGAGSGQQAPSGSGAGGSTPSGGEESSGAPSGSSGSGSSGGEQSGGLVKTVVHEVGSVVEHLLH